MDRPGSPEGSHKNRIGDYVAELIKDSNLRSLRVLGSKRIIEEFLASGKPQGEIDIAATGRDANQVYMAMGLYLKRHPALNIRTVLRSDKVYLIKDTEEEQDGGSSSPGQASETS